MSVAKAGGGREIVMCGTYTFVFVWSNRYHRVCVVCVCVYVNDLILSSIPASRYAQTKKKSAEKNKIGPTIYIFIFFSLCARVQSDLEIYVHYTTAVWKRVIFFLSEYNMTFISIDDESISYTHTHSLVRVKQAHCTVLYVCRAVFDK